MFLGEFLCLLVFKFVWFSTARYRIERMTYRGDASSPVVRHWPIRIAKETRLVEGEQNFNPFIFWIPSICDMLSTCLSYVALNYTSASSFQMLRGSVMVFTALLSVVFLRKKLSVFHWLGIVTVVSGLTVVGVSDIVFSKTPEGSHTNAEKIAGDALILVGMLFTSCQVVYEERFIGKYNIPPLQAVGWEGIFGFCTLGLLLIPVEKIFPNEKKKNEVRFLVPLHHRSDIECQSGSSARRRSLRLLSNARQLDHYSRHTRCDEK